MKRLVSLILTAALVGLMLASCADTGKSAKLHTEDTFAGIRYAGVKTDFSVSAPQAFVYDINSGEIIYTKGAEQVVYPASTAKLLTALAAMSVLDLSEIITPGDELELVPKKSSIAYIKTHHKISVEMLIEGMMLPSGNDAAYALAAAAGKRITGDGNISGKKAVEHFVAYMNGYAVKLGTVGSVFTVPDGFAGKEAYSTVEDMLIISRAAAEDPVISKYAAMSRDDVVYASGHTNTWINTNELLDAESRYYSPYVTGLKTGTSELGKTLIVRASDGDGDYLIGIFGASSDAERYGSALSVTEKLFDR